MEDGMSEWISVRERLPPAGEDVLFFELCPRFGFKLSNDCNNHQWADRGYADKYGEYRDCFNVTHWMPLPESPK